MISWAKSSPKNSNTIRDSCSKPPFVVFFDVMKTKIFLFGARGKMGTTLRSLMQTHATFEYTDAPAEAAAFIDFSAPAALKATLSVASKGKRPLVIGTTGLTPNDILAIKDSAQHIPILYSPNFSLGIALCMETLRLFKNTLPKETRISMEETHHRSKKDAPSGTALLLAQPLSLPADQITTHRSDETLFIHEVKLSFGAETLTLKHESFSREVYAQGALRATEYLFDKPPGLYTMEDLICEKA